jgi:hypothetical protein
MKRYHYILHCAAIGLALMSLSGCNSLFDDAPVNKLTEESIWKDAQLLDSYVAGWYRQCDNGFKVGATTIRTCFKPWWGDQITVGINSPSDLNDFLAGKEKTIDGVATEEWGKRYGQIQVINRMFDNASKIPEGSQKQLTLGEGHFFLAYHHFCLFRLFGGIPLTNGSYYPIDDQRTIARASYDEMVEYITGEAQKAADLLPAQQAATDLGRVTKGAALMLAAKTYMWAAGKPFQNQTKEYLGFTTDKSKEMLQKAKALYDEIIKLGVYSLLPVSGSTQDDIATSYDNIFLTENSSESVFEIQHESIIDRFGHTLDKDAIPPSLGGVVTAYTPTQNHVDEYDMRDGKTYDPQHPYDNRDYRFYANILYDGSVYEGKTLKIHSVSDGTTVTADVDARPYSGQTDGYTKTGYYMRKFLDPTQKITTDYKTGSKQNYIVWRYAEVLLDAAEVNFRLGNTQEALTLVNQVRERVHAAPLTAATLDNILHERRIELAFEETSYWDILRLGEAETRLSGATNPLKKMTVTVDKATGATTYSISNLNKTPETARVFAAMQYHWCIPWEEVDYQHFDQNPGWKRDE